MIVFSLLIVIGCRSKIRQEQNTTEAKRSVETSFNGDSIMVGKESQSLSDTRTDTLKVIVVPCANGYEYAIYNYDLNPIIERELNQFANFSVQPFPLKSLMGVAYQGVFDGKYCLPIIEKVDVDFLILTRFDMDYGQLSKGPNRWGYELRIVHTETLEQINTIAAEGMSDFSKIEEHIRENVERLKADIENFK